MNAVGCENAYVICNNDCEIPVGQLGRIVTVLEDGYFMVEFKVTENNVIGKLYDIQKRRFIKKTLLFDVQGEGLLLDKISVNHYNLSL